MSTSDSSERSGTTAMPAPPKVIVAGFLGTVLEFYDFIVFGLAAALVFGDLFFPAEGAGVGSLLALSSFAIGFVARPVGAAIFGHVGDRIGRRNTLVITLLIMGIASLVIAVLPTYGSIGIWAPILLTVMRIVQGFAFGGEWGGAIALLGEHSTRRRRGFTTSFVQVGAPAGTLLAGLALFVSQAVTDDAQFASWGWRLPFLFGALVALIGLYLRRTIRESPVFEELERQGRTVRAPIVETVRHHWRSLVLGFCVAVAGLAYYIYTVYSLSYLETIGSDSSFGTIGTTIGGALAIPTIFVVGWAIDRVGRRPVYVVSAVGIGAWAFVFFPLLSTGNPLWITVAISGGMIFWAIGFGTQGAFLSEIFPAHVRYTGSGVAYHTATIFGGFVPAVSVALLNGFGSTVAIALFASVLGLVTLVAILFAKETRQVSLGVSADSAHTSEPVR